MTDYLTELFGDTNPSMEEIEAGIAAMLAVEKTRITNLRRLWRRLTLRRGLVPRPSFQRTRET
jgi:hypothetical protein